MSQTIFIICLEISQYRLVYLIIQSTYLCVFLRNRRCAKNILFIYHQSRSRSTYVIKDPKKKLGIPCVSNIEFFLNGFSKSRVLISVKWIQTNKKKSTKIKGECIVNKSKNNPLKIKMIRFFFYQVRWSYSRNWPTTICIEVGDLS